MKVLFAFLACFLASSIGWANSPAPYWACFEKEVGDACTNYGGSTGHCVVQDGCEDSPQSEVNECMYCDTDGSGSDGGMSVDGSAPTDGAQPSAADALPPVDPVPNNADTGCQFASQPLSPSSQLLWPLLGLVAFLFTRKQGSTHS
jgi:hypothetical protein